MEILNYYLIKEIFQYGNKNVEEESSFLFYNLEKTIMIDNINSDAHPSLVNIKKLLSNIKNKKDILNECQKIVKNNHYNLLRLSYCNASDFIKMIKYNKKIKLDVDFFNNNSLSQINDYKKAGLFTEKLLITKCLLPILYSGNQELLVDVFTSYFQQDKNILSKRQKETLWENMYNNTQLLIEFSEDNKKMHGIYLNLLNEYVSFDKERKEHLFKKMKKTNSEDFNKSHRFLNVENFNNNTKYIDDIIQIDEEKRVLSKILNESINKSSKPRRI